MGTNGRPRLTAVESTNAIQLSLSLEHVDEGTGARQKFKNAREKKKKKSIANGFVDD
jgi:hypothetical protein